MKILMDADCLIKLTKAGLKEHIWQEEDVVIPVSVKREVVDAGKMKGLPDADAIEKNINDGLISLAEELLLRGTKGDSALIENFRRGRYEAVATDDARLCRILRASGIPFILPASLIYSLCRKNIIPRETALTWLEELSNFISDDEYSTVKILLEEKP